MISSQAGATGPYGTILGIAKTLVAGGPLESTLQRIVEGVGRAMFAESASLGSYYSERDEYVHEAGWAEGGVTLEEAADVGHVYPLAESPELLRQLQAHGLMERHIDDAGLSPEWREYFTHGASRRLSTARSSTPARSSACSRSRSLALCVASR